MNLAYGRSVAQNRRVRPDPLREIFSPPRKAAFLPQARFLVDFQDIEVVLHHRYSAVDFSPCHDRRSLLRSHPERAYFHNRLLHLYAFDKSTGREVSRVPTPFPVSATPMTYKAKSGRQFVVVATGIGPDAALVAFAVPR